MTDVTQSKRKSKEKRYTLEEYLLAFVPERISPIPDPWEQMEAMLREEFQRALRDNGQRTAAKK